MESITIKIVTNSIDMLSKLYNPQGNLLDRRYIMLSNRENNIAEVASINP